MYVRKYNIGILIGCTELHIIYVSDIFPNKIPRCSVLQRPTQIEYRVTDRNDVDDVIFDETMNWFNSRG